MKIIEALKELPLIEKRINKSISLIQEYSSNLDRGEDTVLPFGDAVTQRKEVDSLVQSVNDLVARKAVLRKNLSITNSNVKVKIDGMEKTITEWIEYREKGLRLMISAQNALNNNNARTLVNSSPVDLQKGVKELVFYDEKTRNSKIEEYENIADKIDSHLEMVNATTDLIE